AFQEFFERVGLGEQLPRNAQSLLRSSPAISRSFFSASPLSRIVAASSQPALKLAARLATNRAAAAFKSTASLRGPFSCPPSKLRTIVALVSREPPSKSSSDAF